MPDETTSLCPWTILFPLGDTISSVVIICELPPFITCDLPPTKCPSFKITLFWPDDTIDSAVTLFPPVDTTFSVITLFPPVDTIDSVITLFPPIDSTDSVITLFCPGIWYCLSTTTFVLVGDWISWTYE